MLPQRLAHQSSVNKVQEINILLKQPNRLLVKISQDFFDQTSMNQKKQERFITERQTIKNNSIFKTPGYYILGFFMVIV